MLSWSLKSIEVFGKSPWLRVAVTSSSEGRVCPVKIDGVYLDLYLTDAFQPSQIGRIQPFIQRAPPAVFIP